MKNNFNYHRRFLNTSITTEEELKEYKKKAPEGLKWCNFLCQDYIDQDLFYNSGANSRKPRSLCIDCCKLLEKLERQERKGTLTPEMFKENPEMYNKVIIASTKTVVCSVCNIEKSGDEFDTRRNTCKKCRYNASKERTNKNLQNHINKFKKYMTTPMA